MEECGKLNVNNIEIKKRIEQYSDYPNVITFHPKIDTFNDNDDNIICLIDLAQQNFQISNKSLLNSYWWLSFKSYCNQLTLIINKYLNNNDDKTKIITDTIFEFIGNGSSETSESISLTSDHHIADLFTDNYFETDTMIALNAPKPKQNFDFLTFSDDNPYANIDKLTINDDKDKNKEEEEEEEEDKEYKIEFIGVDTKTNKLFKWYQILIPKIKSPKTTSRESSTSIYNEMLKHWECKLSQDLRFLIIYPQKLGEICDVYLTKQGKIYWIQSLNSGNNLIKNPLNNTDQFNLRRIFTLNECNVMQQFAVKPLKILISVEEPARFKIMCLPNDQILIWNFSINGASDDLYTIINSTNSKLKNKLLSIDNAQTFTNYRYQYLYFLPSLIILALVVVFCFFANK